MYTFVYGGELRSTALLFVDEGLMEAEVGARWYEGRVSN
jgi:hypothetical protein